MLVTKLKDVQKRDYNRVRILVDDNITIPQSIDKINDREYVFYYYDIAANKPKSKLYYDNDLVYLMN